MLAEMHPCQCLLLIDQLAPLALLVIRSLHDEQGPRHLSLLAFTIFQHLTLNNPPKFHSQTPLHGLINPHGGASAGFGPSSGQTIPNPLCATGRLSSLTAFSPRL